MNLFCLKKSKFQRVIDTIYYKVQYKLYLYNVMILLVNFHVILNFHVNRNYISVVTCQDVMKNIYILSDSSLLLYLFVAIF